MIMFEPVTYYLDRPIHGTVREGERTASWTITEATFNFLTGDQAPPPDGLVFNCHHVLRDAEGNPIPVEILSLLDLEQGLRDSFKKEFGEAWDAVEAGQ